MKTENEIRTEFKRVVIEAIHGFLREKAIKKEEAGAYFMEHTIFNPENKEC